MPGGVTPILDLTGCAAQQGVLLREKLCDRVSFSDKNYATGFFQLIRKLCDRVSCGRKFFRFLSKQWILGKFLCDRVYFWAIFYATGYRVWRALPHTPVTSLVKYPPPPPGTHVKEPY